MAGQGAARTRGQQLDVARVLTGERRLEDGANEVSRGDLVLSAPSRSARDFFQPVYTIVGMNLDQQEGRYRMGTSAGANRQIGAEGNVERDAIDGGDLDASSNLLRPS